MPAALLRVIALLLAALLLASCGGSGGGTPGGGNATGGGSVDTQAPTVIATSPVAASTVTSPATLTMTFSEAMDAATLTVATFSVVKDGMWPVSGNVSYTGTTLTFHPSVPLTSGSYEATLASATDTSGNPLAAPYSWSFTVDADAPYMTDITPAANATFVSVGSAVTIDFSEALAPASITSDSVALVRDGQAVSAVRSLSGTRLTLTPSAPLARNATYTVTLGTGLTDLVGNPLGTAVSSSFSTVMPYFSDYQVITVGSDPEAVAVGDVTGDGRPDIVLTTVTSTPTATDATVDFKLVVVAQDAGGGLAAPVRYDTASSWVCPATSVAVGDVTGDGHADVVVGLGSCGVELFERTPGGDLASSGTLASGNGRAVRLADLNQDGRLDIISAGSGTNISVWYQQAGGGLAAVTTYPMAQTAPRDLEVGDINGNGLPDVITLSNEALRVLPQTGAGSFGTVVTYSLAASGESIAMADMNADNRVDVVLSGGGNQPDARVSRILQQSDGSIASTRSAAYQIPEAVGVGDIDGNGHPDIVVVHPHYLRLGFFLQGSDGQLGSELLSPLPYGQNANAASLALGDINSDGMLDAVTVASDGGKLVVYRNTGP